PAGAGGSDDAARTARPAGAGTADATGRAGAVGGPSGADDAVRDDADRPGGPVRQDGAGEPDAFDRLWSPHRMVYIRGEGKPAGGGEGGDCPFCRAPRLSDEDGLVVARGARVYVVLNLYPYNSGHLMVVPYRHVADYPDLDADETRELAAFTQRAIRTVRA